MINRFFHQPSLSQEHAISLDASHRQDGYVRAVALTIVDRLVSRGFDNGVVAKVLLDKLNETFPGSVPNATHASAIETLELMTSTPQKASRTALEVTWVLRQLMVDSMRQIPVNYLSVFYQQGDVIKPSELRAKGSYVDEAGLTALANILHETIMVHKTGKDKQLPAKLHYGGQGNILIHLDECDGRFTPRVEHKEAFRPLNSITSVKPAFIRDAIDDENVYNKVESLLSHIAQTNSENANWLNNMIEDGSISFDDLLNLYITHANQLTWQRGFIDESTELKDLLVNVAATLMSFGMTSRDELFEAVERQELSSPTMV